MNRVIVAGMSDNGVSSNDEELLRREFRIREPERLPGLSRSVERGVKATGILHWYDETDAVPGNKKPVKCVFGHPHGKGLVVSLEDGRIVLVGRDCAQKDFGFDFALIIRDFDAAQDRQFQIRRMLRVREHLPALIRELENLQDSTAVRGFDAYWSQLGRDFGKFSLMLAKATRSSQGRLIATELEYSEEATERAARKADKERAKERNEPSLYEEMQTAESAEQRRIAVGRWKKFLSKTRKQYVPKPIDMGPCDGWTLLRASDRLTPAQMVAETLATVKSLDLDRPTEGWSQRDFKGLRKSLGSICDTINAARELVHTLIAFTDVGNVARMAAWAQQIEKMDAAFGYEIRADGGALVGKSRLELAEGFRWPDTPEVEFLRHVGSSNLHS